MIKENVRVKERLSDVDRINIIKYLVAGNFTTDENGNTLYTPYFKKINDITAFFLYAVEGLTFEPNIDNSVYESIIGDNDLYEIYDFARERLFQYSEIDEMVKDMVEFEKQKIIHSYSKKDSLSELLDAITEKVKGFDLGSINIKDAFDMLSKIPENGINADSVVDAYFDSDYHKEKEQELVDAKNDKIRELKEENQKLKNQWSGRNVINYPKKQTDK